MPRKKTLKPSQPVAEAKSLVKVTPTDLFAFVGVRRIIGDPLGRLMQDEVADRIQKLVNVLQNVVGLVDALEVLNGTHKGTANTAMRRVRKMLIETLEESMPEWDVVLEQIQEANSKKQQ